MGFDPSGGGEGDCKVGGFKLEEKRKQKQKRKQLHEGHQVSTKGTEERLKGFKGLTPLEVFFAYFVDSLCSLCNGFKD